MAFVDPKVLLANERTYIAWMHMAVVLGGVSVGLLSSAQSAADAASASGSVPTKGMNVTMFMGLLMMPVAIIFAAFAAWLFYSRDKKIRQTTYENMVNETVPIILGGILVSALTGIFIVDVLEGGNIKMKF